jgi:chromosome segregation ATPase
LIAQQKTSISTLNQKLQEQTATIEALSAELKTATERTSALEQQLTAKEAELKAQETSSSSSSSQTAPAIPTTTTQRDTKELELKIKELEDRALQDAARIEELNQEILRMMDSQTMSEIMRKKNELQERLQLARQQIEDKDIIMKKIEEENRQLHNQVIQLQTKLAAALGIFLSFNQTFLGELIKPLFNLN